MQTTQGSVLQSLRAVQIFLDDNADKLAAVVKTGARQKLDDLVAELSGHASTQSGSNLASQSATRKQQSLRTALLRDHMAPIARIAAAELPASPEVEPLKMPKGKPTAARLAGLADGMAKAAGPYSDVFVKAGLPTDFIAQLNAASTAMIDAGAERQANRGNRRGATQGLKTSLSAGRRVVHVLDAFVKSALKDDPVLLANWNLVKRVRVIPRTPTNTNASASTGPTAMPTPAPTPTPPAPPTAPEPAATPAAS
jgi:hypothetical protein